MTHWPQGSGEQLVYEVAFRRYAEASGQVLCPDPGRPCECDENLPDHVFYTVIRKPCPSCKAAL